MKYNNKIKQIKINNNYKQKNQNNYFKIKSQNIKVNFKMIYNRVLYNKMNIIKK